jgi:Tfp pilus assembly protein PilO
MTKEFQKKLLTNAGLALAIIAVLSLILWFISSGVKSISGKISSLRKNYFAQSQRASALSELKKDSQKASYYYTLINNILPKREELYFFSNEISLLAETRGLGKPVFSYTAETPPSDTSPGRASFNIAFEGRYVNILAFFGAIESTRFFVRIKNVDLVMADVVVGNAFRGTLTGEIYFQ